MENQKVFVVTGASKGIGLQIVLDALRQGYKVVGTSRDAEKLRQVVASELPEESYEFLPIEMTFDEESIQAAVDKIIDYYDRIDVLVNNAGYALLGAVEEVSMKEVKENFDVNFFGLLSMTQHVLPYMRKQRSGRIINISSISGTVTGPTQGIYSATKSAVTMLSEALSMELEPFNIQVVAVCPGGVRTDFLDKVSMKRPQKEVTEYTNVQQTLEGFERLNHNQMGDPRLVAKAIITLSEMNQPPRRIYLGSGAVRTMEYHINNVVEEINKYIDLSLSTDIQ